MASYIFRTGLCPLNCDDDCHDDYIYWKHQDCGGNTFVNKEAEVHCLNCHKIFKFENLGFKCPDHTFHRTVKPSDPDTIWYFIRNFTSNLETPDEDFIEKIKLNIELRIGPEKIRVQYLKP